MQPIARIWNRAVELKSTRWSDPARPGRQLLVNREQRSAALLDLATKPGRKVLHRSTGPTTNVHVGALHYAAWAYPRRRSARELREAFA